MKPREFWFSDSREGPVFQDKEQKGKEWKKLIEYSAVASLQQEIKEFKAGVQNFKCPNCHKVAGPFYPVNLMAELEALRKERDKLKNKCSAIYQEGTYLFQQAQISTIHDISMDLIKEIEKERDQLRADLKLAVEALREIWGASDALGHSDGSDYSAYARAINDSADLVLAKLQNSVLAGETSSNRGKEDADELQRTSGVAPIHVIEYSAYEELRFQHEATEKVYRMNREYVEKSKADLKLAVEALNAILSSSHDMWTRGQCEEALVKLQSGGGE